MVRTECAKIQQHIFCTTLYYSRPKLLQPPSPLCDPCCACSATAEVSVVPCSTARLCSFILHCKVRPDCPINAFEQSLQGTRYTTPIRCWINVGSLGLTSIPLSVLYSFILTLTFTFSSILLIFSDTPLTYGRVTVALGLLSHSPSVIFFCHLPLDLRAVWVVKLLFGYPFNFSALLMCTSSSAHDIASEDNFFHI